MTLDENCKCLNKTVGYSKGELSDFDDKITHYAFLESLQNGGFLSNDRSNTHLKETPHAHAMINKDVNGKLTECHQGTCLNGGRCVPAFPGYK